MLYTSFVFICDCLFVTFGCVAAVIAWFVPVLLSCLVCLVVWVCCVGLLCATWVCAWFGG